MLALYLCECQSWRYQLVGRGKKILLRGHVFRVRRKCKDEVALRASCYLRLLARRSDELARN